MPYKHSEYKHHRRVKPSEFIKETFRTVPQRHVPNRRKTYPKGTKMIRGKKKKTGRWATQSVLIPKKKKR